MKLFNIVRPRERLLLIKHSAPFRWQLFWLQMACGASVIVLMGWLLAARFQAAYLLFAGLALVVALAVAARGIEMQRMSRKDEAFCFDREGNSILKDGEPVAALSDMDHIIVRQIIQEDASETATDYAIVLSLQDSRRIVVAESMGLPGGKEEVERAAREIAEFAGVKIEEATRRSTEDWMDIS